MRCVDRMSKLHFRIRPMALPNVPDPVNGMIRTYDNQQRTYSRPFSAKTVFFYKDGDEHFTISAKLPKLKAGVRLPVSTKRYRTIDSLLDDLNTSLYMPFGVRRLTTPMGRTNIEDLDQLQHMGKYVATSSKFPRGINLSALERFAKARQQAHAKLARETDGGQSYWVPASPSFKAKLRMSRSLGIDGIYKPSKQIFFIRNGTSKRYRAVINPSKLPSMEKLLTEVSENLEIAIHRFYTMDGKRLHHVEEMMKMDQIEVLAVPRHDKPKMQERRRFLPPINNPRQNTFTKSFRVSGKTTERTTLPSTSLTASTSSQKSEPENLVEKPRTSVKKIIRSTNGVAPVKRKKSGKAGTYKIQMQGPPIEEDENSSDYPDRRDDVTLTPESRNAALIREEHEDRHHDHHEKREEDLILVDDDDLVIPPREGTANTELESGQSSSEDEQQDTEDERAKDEEDDGELRIPNGVDHEHEENHEGHHHHERDEEEHHHSHDAHDDETDDESYQSSSEDEQPDTDEDESGIDPIVEEEEEDKEMNNNEEHDDTYEISHTPRPINAPPLPPPPGTASSDEERYGTAHHEAATVIQAHVRGYLTRKAIGFNRKTPWPKEEEHNPNTPPPEEPHEGDPATETEILDRDDSPNHSTQSEPIMNESGQMTYSITILTGNRWGADSEVDMFMTIIGEHRMSEKIELMENEPHSARHHRPHHHHHHPPPPSPLAAHCAWLQMRTPKFRQNQLDTFHTTQPQLGTLQKIILGHDTKGYGAGIFVDHVLITENTVDGKQFVFYINKWFDSGQVDGKLVRTCPLSAFYYINSIPGELTPTQGRWEFILHNGLPTGEGGTTSNIRFIGFGSTGVGISTVGNESQLQKVPSTSLIQIDFGNIGELLKVRIEVDGDGAKPDYYLEYVEMRDLDTEERLAVRVSNWLDFTGTRTKKPQSFRELAAQLVGEYSDSGVFPLVAGKDDKKGDYSFKAECVNLGKIVYIKIFPDFTDTGRDIFDGLSVLQGIYERRGLSDIPVGDGMVANSSWVRQSTHDPYRFTLTESHVHDWDGDGEDNGEGKEEVKYRKRDRRQFKRMAFESIKPLLTRSKKREEEDAVDEDDWLLSMHVSGSPSPPRVSLIADSHEFDMPLVETTSDDPPGILHFGLKHAPSLGHVDKLRIWCTSDGDDRLLHIKRMRLVNRANNEQLHYPAATTAPSPDAIIEFPAVYPDQAPKPSLTYTVALETLEVTPESFSAHVQVTGSDSNTGFRPLHGASWTEGERHEFRFEAVDIGTPSSIELRLDPADKDATDIRWSGNAMVASSDSEQHYTIEGQMTITSPNKAVKKKLRPH
ncbi:hypothetical protein PRIPAC_84757 [Pristionchus pacificus]|uniref:Uncharacterized protein n=1 Tax=Pristionchus pacificus TaxID=54126 RepID=A0A2A6BV18_PRIPA|nr:hypothetical protein PRIPAC_84757 [Pristionchus pacificus]|eukprot:PDM69708.1 hypothetical protein PRIPAC_44804 [Pristionchus pacificus]